MAFLIERDLLNPFEPQKEETHDLQGEGSTKPNHHE